jgi:lipoprotein-releasing system permease protein
VVPALENLLGLKFLAKDVYYISDLPSDLHWADVGTIARCPSCSRCWRPCIRAGAPRARNPAEALRYE